jgi:hypothetical protein
VLSISTSSCFDVFFAVGFLNGAPFVFVDFFVLTGALFLLGFLTTFLVSANGKSAAFYVV